MGHMESPSRIQLVRRRLHTARIAIVAGAAAVFVALVGVVRAAHPATPHGRAATLQTPQAMQDAERQQFGFGNGSFGGAAGSSAPQVQSGGS